MKFLAATVLALVACTEAVKVERVERESLALRELRTKGKGKSAGVDPVCLETCEMVCLDTCAIPDCIPLGASASPTTGKSGKGPTTGATKSAKGKGSTSSPAPVSFVCLDSAPYLHPARSSHQKRFCFYSLISVAKPLRLVRLHRPRQPRLRRHRFRARLVRLRRICPPRRPRCRPFQHVVNRARARTAVVNRDRATLSICFGYRHG